MRVFHLCCNIRYKKCAIYSICIASSVRPAAGRRCPFRGQYLGQPDDTGCQLSVRSSCRQTDHIDVVSTCLKQPSTYHHFYLRRRCCCDDIKLWDGELGVDGVNNGEEFPIPNQTTNQPTNQPNRGLPEASRVAWYSGRTSVFDRRTFSVLRSTCSWRVTTYVGKPSAVGQPIRPNQPFILSG